MDLKRLRDLEIELDPSRLRVVRIETDDRDDDIVVRRLAVTDDLVVVGLVKFQRAILLECRVLFANAIDHANQF